MLGPSANAADSVAPTIMSTTYIIYLDLRHEQINPRYHDSGSLKLCPHVGQTREIEAVQCWLASSVAGFMTAGTPPARHCRRQQKVCSVGSRFSACSHDFRRRLSRERPGHTEGGILLVFRGLLPQQATLRIHIHTIRSRGGRHCSMFHQQHSVPPHTLLAR
jgi:hypothetical protein